MAVKKTSEGEQGGGAAEVEDGVGDDADAGAKEYYQKHKREKAIKGDLSIASQVRFDYSAPRASAEACWFGLI